MLSHAMRPFGAAAVQLLAVLGLALAQKSNPSDVLVFERFGNQWFEGPATPVSISGDGNWAQFGRGSADTHLYSLPTGREETKMLMGSRSNTGVSKTRVFRHRPAGQCAENSSF